MENASDALLMAAGVLISIMLISIGTYLFMTFGGYSKEINNNLSKTELQEFNSQFTKYQTQGKEELCTAYDVVTIINLAKDSNKKYGFSTTARKYADGTNLNYKDENNTYIYVDCEKLNGITVDEIADESRLNEFIKNGTNGSEYYYFSCTVDTSKKTGLVKSIKFNISK